MNYTSEINAYKNKKNHGLAINIRMYHHIQRIKNGKKSDIQSELLQLFINWPWLIEKQILWKILPKNIRLWRFHSQNKISLQANENNKM